MSWCPRTEVRLSAAVAALLGATLGCTGSGPNGALPSSQPTSQPTSQPPSQPAGPAPASSAVASASSSADAGGAAAVDAGVVAKAPHEGPLATFHDALRALQAGQRSDHVRVMWLGDSHAQADFWTDHLRVGLQQRFGLGGPGFVRIGYRDYRHAGIGIKVDGRWRMRPKGPSTTKPWGDGAFGLGGILHAGYEGPRRAQIRVKDEGLAKRRLTIDLCYKFGLPQDDFRLEIDGAPAANFKAAGKEDVGKIQHVEREATGLTAVTVTTVRGRPDFCGAVIETATADGPGVVLDNLGINGARYATFLAWNEQAWAAEIKRRPPPELFIFEFGGNEASDLVVHAERYKSNALKLIDRTRAIRADASCLVIGPSERADAEDRIPPIVAALETAAQERGCMFWNMYQKMGGKGSIRKWRDDDLGARDGVHLRPQGYAKVGQWLLDDVMAGYTP